MKMKTIEQKAKAYDEAINRVKNIKTGKCETTFMFTEGLFEYIFPEFKEESEDEKIRKEIISALQYANHKGLYDKHLAWLEKQRKSKFEQCIQDGDKIVTNEDGTHFNVSQLERVVKKEPKSAWSEEDERLCKCIIEDQEEALDDVRNDKYGHSEIISDLKDMYRERINWLKSLKERIKPQWKPSEEQIRTLRWWAEYGASEHIKTLYEELKKLKEK